jgi:16S rRNA (guanine966-N2)-methyltransferase
VRETLFNWLGQTLEGKSCLDLFAGTGALGFEALSRGAASVVMVEKDRGVARILQSNARKLVAQPLEIVAGDALQYLQSAQRQFDLVFLDPPFDSGLLDRVLRLLPPRLPGEALVYVESEPAFEPDANWRILKSSRAGNVKFALLGLATESKTNNHGEGSLPRHV